MDERRQSVFERREIQEGRLRLDRRRHGRLTRIGRGAENAFLDLLVALADFVAFGLPKLLHLVHVALHGVGEVGEIVGQQIGVGQAHHGRAGGLRQCAAVDEIGVGEVRVPVEIVVDGVIDAAAVFAAEAQVQRSDAQWSRNAV
jgi:hypothetical protein